MVNSKENADMCNPRLTEGVFPSRWIGPSAY